jgi:glycosyltransferase involved in cell wall biosynthesis
MISVLTLTYQRHHLLEEAIYSFLSQDWDGDAEMVIINDSPIVKYEIDNPKVRIINCDKRFSSISRKLEFGFKQCKGDYIYRLDDDDLMTPWALTMHSKYRELRPNMDVYRCQKHYFFCENKYQALSDSINNGNTYKKEYIERIPFNDSSMGEDNYITFFHNATIYTADLGRYTMIYRWGMNTFHVSGMGGDKGPDYVNNAVDMAVKHIEGTVKLQPKFKSDYYSFLPEYNKD